MYVDLDKGRSIMGNHYVESINSYWYLLHSDLHVLSTGRLYLPVPIN